MLLVRLLLSDDCPLSVPSYLSPRVPIRLKSRIFSLCQLSQSSVWTDLLTYFRRPDYSQLLKNSSMQKCLCFQQAWLQRIVHKFTCSFKKMTPDGLLLLPSAGGRQSWHRVGLLPSVVIFREGLKLKSYTEECLPMLYLQLVLFYLFQPHWPSSCLSNILTSFPSSCPP